MKYLPKETCEYLVSLGCVSESERYWCEVITQDPRDGNPPGTRWVLLTDETQGRRSFPAFFLEDILRKDVAEKIWKALPKDWYIPSAWELVGEIVEAVYDHPDTWPEEVSKLIQPTP